MGDIKDIFIKQGDCFQRIELNEVYFFTKTNNKVVAILKGNRFEISTTLNSLTEMIDKNNNFFRCHKSFIININKVSNISKISRKTYNVNFKGIGETAYITQTCLKILTEKVCIL